MTNELTERDRNVTQLERLIKDFETKALKLGYTMEAVSLYDKEMGRFQINWNDKADEEEITHATEAIALSLWKMANEDDTIVKDALFRSHFYTEKGKKDLGEIMTETLARAIGQGVALGRQILEEKKEEYLKLEDGKGDSN